MGLEFIVAQVARRGLRTVWTCLHTDICITVLVYGHLYQDKVTGKPGKCTVLKPGFFFSKHIKNVEHQSSHKLWKPHQYTAQHMRLSLFKQYKKRAEASGPEAYSSHKHLLPFTHALLSSGNLANWWNVSKRRCKMSEAKSFDRLKNFLKSLTWRTPVREHVVWMEYVIVGCQFSRHPDRSPRPHFTVDLPQTILAFGIELFYVYKLFPANASICRICRAKIHGGSCPGPFGI
ncbi:hypothetical protein B0J11DRAFT_322028 [Dendryphion nanum]|uniref:Uncharacterized protein n=1 Tax=Dendryphion nanum TaxID=256645 RepID=A0A9P9DRL1_9PLEO|nr:hypothetical protein B0J11DRAFT_322028 [Dendryphion nanum]